MKLKERIDQKADRLAAISTEIAGIVGDEDSRTEPLSDDERARVDALEAEETTVTAELEQLQADQERIRRQANRQQRLASTSRGTAAPPVNPGAGDTPEGDAPTRIRPIRRHRHLRAFTGGDPQQDLADAYLCGQFLLSVLAPPDSGLRANARAWCKEHGLDLLAMSTGSDIKGGATVPIEFENRVIDLRETYGVFRRNSRISPMASDTKTTPRRTGGLTVYYPGEGGTITQSDKGWDNVKLVARKPAVMARYSSELDEDSIITLADDLAAEAAYAFAKAEDEAGFKGDGTSTYAGIVGLITACAAATATVVTAATGNTQFETLDLKDFESMVGKLPEYAEPNAKWYISRAGWGASMLRLLDAAGGNTRDQLEGKAQLMFLGYPVVISQVMNTTLTAQTSTNGLCYFGDLSLASTFGDRRGISVKMSEHLYLASDQIAVQATERYDIKVHDVGDTSDAGAMVMLATPAS